MSRVGQYHLRTPHKEGWKLIRHIRVLLNMKALKQISHEGTEDGDTYTCLILRPISKERFELIEKNLEGLGLKMI